VDAALKKGDLKFTLHGYKLKGSWVLVRTSGRYAGARSGPDGRSWLLIKHRDEWAGELDITEFAPRSVKSDGDFEDILGADAPATWQSHRPAKGGETGAMFDKIIEKAAKLKAARSADRKPARKSSGHKATKEQSSGHETTKPRSSGHETTKPRKKSGKPSR
jgi:bifunctional non-homologous end joining protein LigD